MNSCYDIDTCKSYLPEPDGGGGGGSADVSFDDDDDDHGTLEQARMDVLGPLAFADIDFVDGDSGELVARISGYECVMDASLAEAFRNNQLPRETRK